MTKSQIKIDQVREDSRKIPKSCNGRIAVIVETGSAYGVQFWTPEMIDCGTSTNTDKSISIMVCQL